MTALLARIKAEPAMFVAIVGALIALGVAFGLSMTTEQTGAVLAFVTLVLGFVTRSQVSPAATEPPPVP